MFDKIKKIRVKDLLSILIIAISVIPGMLLRLVKRDIWIIAENGDDAKDNGYAFFEYLMKNSTKKDIYYVINKKSIYYPKLAKYPKNILYQNSIKHNIYTIASNKYISSQIGAGLPFPRIVFNLQGTFLYRFKSVFLQHGITQNKPECLLPNNSKVDLFCCAGNKEYDFVINELGYEKDKVKKTGFCRYDLLKDESKDNNKILMMFTWRQQFEENEEAFLNSKYYKNIIDLLNNKRLIDFIETNKLEINLCLHDNMIKYKDKFVSSSDNIKILDKTEKSIHELLKECKYLVTDYSSVAFDFAYMKKPLQYFMFDYDDFRKNHIKEGYWNYQEGFGKATYTVDECVEEIIKSYENNFKMEDEYVERMQDFYIFCDENNSERTYDEIKHIPEKEKKRNIDSWWILDIIVFIFGAMFSQVYVLLASVVIGLVLNILYATKETRKRIYFLIFNITMFTFLISRPLISTIKSIDWIGKFSVDSQVHSLLFIMLALVCIYIGARIAEKKQLKTRDSKNKFLENLKYKNNESIKKFQNISLILFGICAVFSIITEYDKLIYMQGKDYVEYYLTYQNNFNALVTLAAGMTNMFLGIFLATMPEKKKTIIPIIVFIIYNLPTFLIGQRTPLVIAVLFVFTYFIIRDYLDNTKEWIGRLEKRILIIIIPIGIIALSIFNYSRVKEDLPTNNIIGLFGDFFYSQGVSYDVLNIGYSKKDTIKELTNSNYTFGPFIDYFKYSTISQTLFATEDLPTGNNEIRALKSSSYSHIISYLSRPDYLDGHGYGSSFLLETYTDFGYLGIIIYSLILGYFLAIIPELLKKNLFISSIVLISTLNIFIIPRAEALQFLQFIITPQFWGAWIACGLIFGVLQNIENKIIVKEGKVE